MASSSTRSLSDNVLETSRRNAERERRVPAIAATSPFDEILIEDVLVSLPPELREHAHGANTVAALNEWITAGTIVRTLGRDAYLRSVFLERLQGDPTRASLALAEALASRLPPPPASRARQEADAAGLALQLAAAGWWLAARAVIAAALGLAGLSSFATLADWTFWFGSLFAVPLLSVPAGTGPLPALLFTGAALWHVVEIRLAPGGFERARKLPATLRELPPLYDSRLDAFRVAWCLQASVCWAMFTARAAMCFRDVRLDGSAPLQTLAVAAVFAMLPLATVPAVLKGVRLAWQRSTGQPK